MLQKERKNALEMGKEKKEKNKESAEEIIYKYTLKSLSQMFI